MIPAARGPGPSDLSLGPLASRHLPAPQSHLPCFLTSQWSLGSAHSRQSGACDVTATPFAGHGGGLGPPKHPVLPSVLAALSPGRERRSLIFPPRAYAMQAAGAVAGLRAATGRLHVGLGTYHWGVPRAPRVASLILPGGGDYIIPVSRGGHSR